MYILTKENIIEYLRLKLPKVVFGPDTTVIRIGESGNEEEGDGYLNYVFKVSTNSFSCIVKQALEHMRHKESRKLPAERNKLEYDIMCIRYHIVPEYVPEPYFYDEENHIFAMEDCSHLKIPRFQLTKNIMYDHFAENCAHYLAATHFYTSEYFLETDAFRNLTSHFMSPILRKIMEDSIFVTLFGEHQFDYTLGDSFLHFAKGLSDSPEFKTERYKLRHSFISNGECLVHGDLHTSNMFAGDNALKVIDMEFTFGGPFSYDIGYLIGNLLSQYAAACYRDFTSAKEQSKFKTYLLTAIRDMYHSYVNGFMEHWNQDAKEIYKGIPGLQDEWKHRILTEAPGYAAIVNWFRVAGEIPYPDFDMITDLDKKRDAMSLSLMIDWQLIFHRHQYESIDDLIQDVLYVEQQYSSTGWKEKAAAK